MCDLDPLRLWMVSVCVALDRAIGSGTRYDWCSRTRGRPARAVCAQLYSIPSD